MPLHLGLVTK